MADGAQQNGVAGLQQVDGPGGHHLAPAEKMFRAPIEILKRKGEIVFPGGFLQDAFGLRNDFLPTPSPAITAIVRVFMQPSFY